MGVGPADAALGRADIGAAGLDQAVDAIRSTISTVEDGRRVTYPFDAATARRLYTRLFGLVADRLPTIAHLIFEPDGAMLRLPIKLLVTSDLGLAAYEARLIDHEDDPFAIRQIAWLGRTPR